MVLIGKDVEVLAGDSFFLNTFIVHIHYYTYCSIPKITSRNSPPGPLCLELLYCVLGAGQLEATRAAKSQLLRLAHFPLQDK